MILDWYTVIFQTLNFLILVFLLRMFLYQPIVRAMEERQQMIASKEEDARAAKEEARRELKLYRQRAQELEGSAQEVLRSAREAAEEEKQGLMDEAREQVRVAKERWEDAFRLERESFTHQLRQAVGRQACAIARRCLSDLADASLNQMAWRVFLSRLEALSQGEIKRLREGLSREDGSPLLKSAFDLSPEMVQELEAKLREILEMEELELRSVTDPSLLCGLELEVGGYHVAWSVSSYLEGIEERILGEMGQVSGRKAGEGSRGE